MTLFVDGTPTPQGSKNAYVINNRAILVDASGGNKAWRKTVTEAIKSHYSYKEFKGAVSVTLMFHMPQAKSNKKPKMTQKPDVDKLARSICDALTDSGAIQDDQMITRLYVFKQWATDGKPGVFIMVAPDDTP